MFSYRFIPLLRKLLTNVCFHLDTINYIQNVFRAKNNCSTPNLTYLVRSILEEKSTGQYLFDMNCAA